MNPENRPVLGSDEGDGSGDFALINVALRQRADALQALGGDTDLFGGGFGQGSGHERETE